MAENIVDDMSDIDDIDDMPDIDNVSEYSDEVISLLSYGDLSNDIVINSSDEENNENALRENDDSNESNAITLEIDTEVDNTIEVVEVVKESNPIIEPIIEPIMRTGLVNNGNECFINSVMQCLAASRFIHAFLMQYKEEDDKVRSILVTKHQLGKIDSKYLKTHVAELLETETDMDLEENTILSHFLKYHNDMFIYTSFKTIINTLSQHKSPLINCSSFVNISKEISQNSGFSHLFSGEQNDPHEFLAFLLDKIHNAKCRTIIMNLPSGEYSSYAKLYLSSLKQNYENNYSNLVKNLIFFTINIIECYACKEQSQSVSPTNLLITDIPRNRSSKPSLTIYDCLDEYFKIEDIDYKCEKCCNTSGNRMDKKILTKPKSLIIKIKRYEQFGSFAHKITDMIHYPETLSLNKYYCSDNIQDYNLYGVVNHVGNINGGHYYSYVKEYNHKNNTYGNNWYLCNDSIIQQMTAEQAIKSSNAYMLFYYSNN
jgi:ubiquitin C-terminal hydrolase